MKVCFRVDASLHIGNGHVMRCLSLAEVLKSRGHEVIFVMRQQEGDLCDYTQKLDFKVIQLPQPDKCKVPEDTSDYEAWLQVPVLTDAEDFLLVAGDADLVVVDHYGIDSTWEELVKSRSLTKLVAIDDLIREHKADLIIDQTVGREICEYQSTSPESEVITGTKFALLNIKFAEMHPLAVNKRIDTQEHRLLLTMGGVDSPNATLETLSALKQRTTPIPTTVLLCKDAPHYLSVSSFCEKNSDWISHIQFSNSMATLMFEHTLAIGAPGSTSWERACMGLPSIVVPLADNQKQISQNLVQKNAAISLSIEEIPELLNIKLDELLQRFDTMRDNNLRLCDGKGCERVVDKLNNLWCL